VSSEAPAAEQDRDVEEPLPPGIVRALRADPDHAPELLMRYAVERLAGPAAVWARDARRAHPDRPAAHFAATLRRQTALNSRVQGAIAGTPFLLALVPAYVAVLWDQAWMTLRIAALHGRDLDAPGLAAELLVLRGVHPTLAESQAALDALGPRPRKRLRGGLKSLYHLGERIMVLAGFLDPPQDGAPAPWPKRAALFLLGGVLYVATWVMPLSFMVVMSHSCEVSTKRMADRAVGFYRVADDPGAPPVPLARRHRARTAVIALLAAGVPLAVIAFANHQIQSDETEWIRIVGALLGLSLVIGLVALARRPAR
jgi:hypothetical protein